MISLFPQIKEPSTRATVTFAGLFFFLILGIIIVNFLSLDLSHLSFLIALACCGLITKNVYDRAFSKQSEITLRQKLVKDISGSSQELYTQLYKNSPVPYILIDRDGIIDSGNVASSRLLGVPQIKVKDLNIFGRMQCESLDHLDLLINKYQSGISVSDETVQVKRMDGEFSWALMSLFQFTDDSGRQMGLMTLVDITKQKNIENAKTEFVSLASHQLRTPIAGIKWSAELLELDAGKTLTPQQKRYVDRLLTGVSRMALIVDDFLRVSRFELGTFQPEYVSIDLERTVHEIIAEQAPRVTQKKIEIKTFFDETIKTLVTDQNLLRMILSNLYSNAVKYTREEGTIHIGFSKKDDEIHLSIADNGMGIPMKDQDYIFSKLFRASNAVRNIPDGTGLGLYIVKQAVDVLRGRVSFTSVEDVGTTFEIVLPLSSLE